MWQAAEARRDTRPPLAHVTFARPSRRAALAEQQNALRWAKALELGAPTVRLDKIALYTWSEDRKVTLFRIVQELPLGAAAGAP